MAITNETNIKPVNFEAIPAELKKHSRWLLWKKEKVSNEKGVYTKQPVNKYGRPLKNWQSPSSLESFPRIKSMYENGNFDGIGFVPKDTGIIVLDLDDLGGFENWTDTEKEIALNGYTEYSPSGEGLHCYYSGELTPALAKHFEGAQGKKDFKLIGREERKLEMFVVGGYITVTGDIFETKYKDDIGENTETILELIENNYKAAGGSATDTSELKEDKRITGSMTDDEILKPLLNVTIAGKNLKVADLYNGDTTPYNDDSSAADMALVNEITYFTQDPQQIARIWLNSPLGQRGKTQERIMDYVKPTINKSLNNRHEKGIYYEKPNFDLSFLNESEAEITENQISELVKEHPQKNAAYLLNSFFDDMKEAINTPAISTGFGTLDEILDGGLYEGLYCIGAISSLGKTTMVTQIVDHIAGSGQDVIFISLEMSKNEILAKGLSRLTKIITERDGLPNDCPKSAREITRIEWHKNYSTAAKGTIAKAIKEYQEICNHLWIHEGIGNIGVEQIKAITEAHIEATGNTPVIVIDYLQILAPYSERATDKQATDKAVLELKRLSRDKKIPVIAISSLNRTSYNEPISMTAFKESGAIEYSSDVLIGLQLKGVEQNKTYTETGKKKIVFDVDAAKAKPVREIELKILKNRNGRTGGMIEFEYAAKYNHFIDLGEAQKPFIVVTDPKREMAKRG